MAAGSEIGELGIISTALRVFPIQSPGDINADGD
jgi:hypothetical protein